MSKKLYVGNLSWKLKDNELKEIFEITGFVKEANIVTDRNTGKSRGFGFVTYEHEEDALLAIEKINGHEILGRTLLVSEAREKNDDLPKLKPVTYSKGVCILCRRPASVHGFENHTEGACDRCIKTLNFYVRELQSRNRNE